eukprot:3688626-Amphidinium_carterae.1
MAGCAMAPLMLMAFLGSLRPCRADPVGTYYYAAAYSGYCMAVTNIHRACRHGAPSTSSSFESASELCFTLWTWATSSSLESVTPSTITGLALLLDLMPTVVETYDEYLVSYVYYYYDYTAKYSAHCEEPWVIFVSSLVVQAVVLIVVERMLWCLM